MLGTKQLQTDSDRRELKSHGSYQFPVYVDCKKLSSYERSAFNWHWHPEIELTLFLEGGMIYQVNDKTYHVREGQGLFCNTNALHAGYMQDNEDCRYVSITFHPRMVYGFEGSLIQREFADPILRNLAVGSRLFTGKEAWEREILADMKTIFEEMEQEKETSPLLIQECILRIWRNLFESGISGNPENEAAAEGRDVERIRQVLDYLHGHYAEHITLEQIAGQMNLCRSESCRFFKKYMKQSVFEYLQNYRIEKSIALLSEERYSITEVALLCGFASPAYFAKIFKAQMKCTPMNYRKLCRARGGQEMEEAEETVPTEAGR
ncbi:MAG: AraC family transcriptional regulator [Lachnospiraceae bacterium]|nr:AraC family transcriptional regulator [Lachnospiraceae bacterium]